MGAATAFDVDSFVGECRAALGEDRPTAAVREVLLRHLGDAPARAATASALPPERAGIEPLHVADDLTVLQVVWGPRMTLFPHDHRMWAAIGIYAGVEDNEFFRRDPKGLTSSGGRVIEDGDVLALGADAIHSVHNPRRSFTGAIHVYGGNFFTTPRSEWDPETREESPYDFEHTRRLFEESNAAVES
jgi:predicted metal-dependent enzyme (double-stranded beta helix superfamily)